MLSRITCLAAALTLLTVALLPASAQERPAAKLAFKALSGEATGLKAIMEQWKADESKRQGTKDKLSWWTWGLVALDYDNDGCLDLILQQHAAPGCLVLRGTCKDKGAVGFVNVTEELGLGNAAFTSTFRPRVWDIDGDGTLDLMGTSTAPAATFFNEGKKFAPMKFSPGPVYALDPRHDVLDLNGDGYLDFHTTDSKYLYDPKTIMFQRSAYQPPLHAKPPEAIAELVAEKKKIRFFHIHYVENDLNGDGIPDLVAGGFASYSRDSFTRCLLGAKDGRLIDQTETVGLPLDGVPVLVADLTGDGCAEVLISGGARAGLYINNGAGKFTLREGDVTSFLAKQGPYAHTAFPAHLKNDGNVDLVLCNPRGGQSEIYENLGGGNFKRVVQAGSWEEPIAIGDFNNDGLLDVAIGGPKDTVTIYLNETANPGKACRILPRMDKPNPYAVGARVEVFRAGDLDKPGARPFWSEKAHAEATPIHVGLGAATRCDLRITFPGKEPKVVTHKNVEAKGGLVVHAAGRIEAAK